MPFSMKRKSLIDATSISDDRSLCETCGDFFILLCKSCPTKVSHDSDVLRRFVMSRRSTKRSRLCKTPQWTVAEWITVYADQTLHHGVTSRVMKKVERICQGELLYAWIPICRGLHEFLYQAFHIREGAQVMGEPDFDRGYLPHHPEQLSECPNFPDAAVYKAEISIDGSQEIMKMMRDLEREMMKDIIHRWMQE